MDPITLKYILLAIILTFAILDFWLIWLNYKYLDDKIPPEFQDIYPPEKYKQAVAYERESLLFSAIEKTVSLILIAILLLFNGFAYIDQLAHKITCNKVWVSVWFFILLFAINFVVGIPFSYYQKFVLDKKYGLSTIKIKTFLLDLVKSFLLGAVLIGILVYALALIYYKFQDKFWILAFAVIAIYSILLSLGFVDLIIRLFNKLYPLEAGTLRDKISEYVAKVGYKLKDIKVIDSSKRSKRLNAFFSGFGPKKTVVLYDTLIDKLEVDEIVAVLAHEIGHYKHKHLLKNSVISFIVLLLFLILFQQVMNSQLIAEALGTAQPSFHINLIGFVIIFQPLEFLISIVTNYISRNFERQADMFAKKTFSGKSLALALKKISVENLSALKPHPLYVKLTYSHPPVLERVKYLELD